MKLLSKFNFFPLSQQNVLRIKKTLEILRFSRKEVSYKTEKEKDA